MTYNDFTFESLGEGIEICISDEHRFGTDAFLLADFSAGRHKDICADLCTGSGIIALLLHKFYKPQKIYAVEIQEKAHEQLKVSLERSKIDTIQPVLGDLNDWRSEKELDLITCNPPYKINNTGAKNDSEAVSIARHEMLCTIDDVCRCAKKNLKFGGRLCICNRPERYNDGNESQRYRAEAFAYSSQKPGVSPMAYSRRGQKGRKAFCTDRKAFVCAFRRRWKFGGDEENIRTSLKSEELGMRNEELRYRLRR